MKNSKTSKVRPTRLRAKRKRQNIPARYHHGNLRAALIEAGLKALEVNDRRELSLRELARRVGVSANASYRHFANKEALLSALAAEGFRRLQAAYTKATAQQSRSDAGFRATGRAYVHFAIDNPALFRLMFEHFTLSPEDPELLEASLACFQWMLNFLAGVIGLTPDDPRVLMNALVGWSTVHGLSHLVLSGQLDYFGGVTDQLIDAVVNTDVPLFMTPNT